MKKQKIDRQTKYTLVLIALAFACLTMPTALFAQDAEQGKYEGELIPVEIAPYECETSCGCGGCAETIQENHELLKLAGASSEFQRHRDWLVEVFFNGEIRYAMSLMTNQMTAVMLQQVKILGGFFDAKHQLETQRLFQTLMAKAHEDYQPSTGMCDIGTTTRGLIISERKTDLVKQALSNRIFARHLKSGQNISMRNNSDEWSRIYDFKQDFCDDRDNGGQLKTLCVGGSAPRINRNKDVDYTRTVDSNLTLDVGFALDDMAQGPDRTLGAQLTPDEKAVFALMSNLFAHKTLDIIGERVLADGYGNPRAAAVRYQTLRSVAAKRSVATNSIAAIIAERGSGNANNGIIPAIEYAPFVKSVMFELGTPPEEIDFILGKNPSYFAQMEVLTKKLYQDHNFYTELYDKPVNVLRKGAALRAIGLMQDRDMFKSLLRNEAVLAVTLETMLKDEHEAVYSKLSEISPDGESRQP